MLPRQADWKIQKYGLDIVPVRTEAWCTGAGA
jgi:hypothetical protein